jgi:hypothetical protein
MSEKNNTSRASWIRMGIRIVARYRTLIQLSSRMYTLFLRSDSLLLVRFAQSSVIASRVGRLCASAAAQTAVDDVKVQ